MQTETSVPDRADDLAAVRTYTMDNPLPLVVEAATSGMHLPTWLATRRAWLDEHLNTRGAVLFRGFGIASQAQFHEVAGVVSQQVKVHANWFQPGDPTGGNARTAVTYPPNKKLFLHNEDNFNHTAWPKRIMFCCTLPAAKGGETPIADCRRVLDLIDKDVRDRFIEQGVLYVDNMRAEFGYDWRRVFGMTDKSQVARYLEQREMQGEWVSDDWLRLRYVRPAALHHPVTGDPLWCNLAHHQILSPERRQDTLREMRVDELPTNTYYGDGGVIDDATMQHIRDAYERAEVAFPWQKGDVLVVDNLLCAHSRNAFEGKREVYVAFGDRITLRDLTPVKQLRSTVSPS